MFTVYCATPFPILLLVNVKFGPEPLFVTVIEFVKLPKFCLLTNKVAVCEEGVAVKSVIL